MSETNSTHRWDGRTWLARAVFAAVPVLVSGLIPSGRDDLRTVTTIAVVWLVLVSVSHQAKLRRPALVTIWLAAAVDIVGLVTVGLLTEGYAEVLVVLSVGVGMLHATDLGPRSRVVLGAAIVAAQALEMAGEAATLSVATVVALDAAAALLGLLLLGERDRHRRRSQVALDRADQLTDAVLAGIGEAVVVTDATGTISSVNDAAEATFGHAVAGTCHGNLRLHLGAGALDCANGCPLLDDTGVGQADVHRDHPNGTRQALLVNARAVRDPLGRTREVVHSFRDITTMKRAEQAKTLFLATASHELKTPLAIITGYVSLLEAGELPEDRQAEAVATIRDRCTQLSSIIDRLLLASRIEGGGLSLAPRPTQLRPILEERVTALQAVTARTMHLHLPDEPLPTVEADETAVATVLDHLIENAVKYSPDGGPVVVEVTVGDDEVTTSVSDQGVGMSSRDAEHAFDAFWQAEGDDTRRFGGSGVGLYIVRSLSRAMGGETVVARTAPGRGTTFALSLARTDAERRQGPEEAEPRPDTMADEFMRQMGVGRVV